MPRRSFQHSILSQLENSHGAETYTHLDGLYLDAVAPEDVPKLIGADVPEEVLAWDI